MKQRGKKITVNIASESEISVQGHGVHTAYEEMASSLEKLDSVTVIRGKFGHAVACDIIHLHTIGVRSLRKLLQRGPKKVVSVHVVPESFLGSVIGAKYWLFMARWYMKFFYNRADLLIAVSGATKQHLLDMGITRPILIEYNSIDTAKYAKPNKNRASIRKKLGFQADSFVVMGAGQVQPRKRLDSFIAAARALPDVSFVWIGGMPFGRLAADNNHMDKLMKNAPKNVCFPGIVGLDEMPSYYHAADLFFLPSDQETFGLVILEAAAAGLPVLARRLNDYADSFGDDILQCDEKEFAEVIERLASAKNEYTLWQKASRRVAVKFDSVASAKRYVTIYRNLL